MRAATVMAGSEALRLFDRLANPARLTSYSKIILILYALAFGWWMAMTLPGLADPNGQPFGYDFLGPWSAARLALEGQPASAYDLQAIAAVQQAATPGADAILPYPYPPTNLLLLLGFGLAPYPLAATVFMALNLCLWIWLARRTAPEAGHIWMALAFPPALICFTFNQNAFITASLMLGSLTLLDKRPIAAGALIGLMAIKPHLALLLPVALLASGRWRVMASAAATLALLVLASLLMFGIEPWRAFFNHLSQARALLDSGAYEWAIMPTLYVFAQSIGVSANLALGLQIIGALAAATMVWIVWRRREAPFAAQAACLCAATLMVSPHLYNYDLLILGPAIAWLAGLGLATGFRAGERPVLIAAWLGGGVLLQLSTLLGGMQLGAAFVIATAIVAARRALAGPT